MQKREKAIAATAVTAVVDDDLVAAISAVAPVTIRNTAATTATIATTATAVKTAMKAETIAAAAAGNQHKSLARLLADI